MRGISRPSDDRSCGPYLEDDDVAREAGLKSLIGSTGTGVGSALARRILSRGVTGAVRFAKDVPALAPYVRDSAELLDLCYDRGESILIEGTQGTGLSLLHGSFSYVTSRDTTVTALLSEVGTAPQRLRRVIVVFRAYPIRVGGPSGPMGKELTWEAIAGRAGLHEMSLSAVEVGSVSGNVNLSLIEQSDILPDGTLFFSEPLPDATGLPL